METIGDRIKAGRLEKKLSQEALGKLAGVGKSSVCQWEKGTTKNLIGKNLTAIAIAIDRTETFLLTGKGQKYRSTYEKNAIEHKGNISSIAEPIILKTGADSPTRQNPLNLMPVLDAEQAKNWQQALSDYQPAKNKGMIPHKDAQITQNTFVFIAQGDSMSPLINAGDACYVDPEKKAIHKNIVLAEIAGDIVIRQLWIEAGDTMLIPTNKQMQDLKKPLQTAKIIGVVTMGHTIPPLRAFL
jgi:SOS-response transcriptional repressor LexA